MKSEIQIGIVGAGVIGRDHANCLHRNKRVGGVWIFDADASRAQGVADQYKLRVAKTLDDLLKAVDLVWICTPPFAHRGPVEAACRAGKAVFCEKPLAHEPREAEAIRDVVREAKVPFFMGQSGRYTTPFALMKQMLDRGDIGRPTLFTSTRLGYLDPAGGPPWRFDDAASGGAIVELGVHEIDFINWTGGPWRSLYALGSSTLVGEKFQDTVVSVGALASGARARVELSWSSPRYLWERSIQGEAGTLYFNDAKFTSLEVHRPGKPPQILPTGDPDWMDHETGENLTLRAQDAAIVDAMLSGATPPVTLDDGLAALRVAVAMRKSIAGGTIETLR